MRIMVGSMGGGVSTPDKQHLCGLPSVEIMRSMPSPQHCEYVLRVRANAMRIVHLYIDKRCHAMVRVRRNVYGGSSVCCFDARGQRGAICCGACVCTGGVRNMRLRCSSLTPMHTICAECANYGMGSCSLSSIHIQFLVFGHVRMVDVGRMVMWCALERAHTH